MPYKSKAELPPAVRKRSAHDQERWMKVWNDVFDKSGSEKEAFKAANGAINLSEALAVRMACIFATDQDSTMHTSMFGDAFPEWDPAGKYEVQVMRTGKWQGHPEGPINITAKDLADAIENYNSSTRKSVLDYNHGTDFGSTHEETIAAGWLADLWIEDGSGSRLTSDDARAWKGGVLYLKGLYEVTQRLNEYLKAGEYMFYSPTFSPNYKSKETGKSQGLTLLRGAATNTPWFDGMEQFKLAATERAQKLFAASELKPGAQARIIIKSEKTLAQLEADFEAIGVELICLENWGALENMPAMPYSEPGKPAEPTERKLATETLVHLFSVRG